jgi:hypothetical protein
MPHKASLLLLAMAIIAATYAGWVWLRRGNPTSIRPDELNYPCLRIIDGTNWERIDNVEDLQHIGSDRFMNRKEDPLIIDSEFHVCEMSRLNMKSSPLSLLVTGPRRVELDFELINRSEKTTQDAKAIMTALLSHKQRLADNSTDLLPTAASMSDFLELLETQRSVPQVQRNPNAND